MKQYFVAFFVVVVFGTLDTAVAPPAAGTEAAETRDAANAWGTSSESKSRLASCSVAILSSCFQV